MGADHLRLLQTQRSCVHWTLRAFNYSTPNSTTAKYTRKHVLLTLPTDVTIRRSQPNATGLELMHYKQISLIAALLKHYTSDKLKCAVKRSQAL